MNRAGEGVNTYIQTVAHSLQESLELRAGCGHTVLVTGHEAGHESEGVSGILLLDLSVKSETQAQGSAQGTCTAFDLYIQ